jgi:serine/threonine protein kinase
MSTPQDQAARIFEAAVELQDPAERAAYVAAACGTDQQLRAEVEQLLAHDDAAGSFLNRPALPGLEATVVEPRLGEQPGTVLGPYKLREQIGEGGFGVVFLAEQQAPIRRKVALKILKPGMDSKQVIARFEAERQALALMDHANIARVLDAGQTDSGRPYFVMDLVKGLPITAYCDQAQLTPRQRLELFVHVCQAVQHAHQKAIIHRDLKPSNVLVTLQDGRALVKVIDFGIAKALGQQLTDKTVFTGFAQLVGTPLYMSPEQAALSNVDVDTRSDIYSLGVLLYELLTGTTPFDRERLRQVGFDEMRRIIREEEPPRPSTRLSTLGQAGSTVSAQRQSDPKRLSQLFRGELDWIVMKCLEKDRNRRYETASGLALDVQRYLAGEPVLAVPPSTGYRLRKFARKYQVALTTAAAMIFLLVAGAAVSTWQAVRALQAEAEAWQAVQDAEQAQRAERARAEGEAKAKLEAQLARDAKEQARQKEEQERKYAQGIAKYVIDDVLALTSVEGQEQFGGMTEVQLDKDATLRQLLDRAAAKLNQRKDLDPRTEAELRWIIGVNYRGLGEAELAISFLERCVALRKGLFGPDHVETLNAQNNLAGCYQNAGKLNLALPLLEETLTLSKAKLGADHPDTLVSMNSLALGYQSAGKLNLAVPLLEETLNLRKAKLGADHPDTHHSMNNLAVGYLDAGKLDLALPLLEETLKHTKARLGPDHSLTLNSMNNLAMGYQAAGKPGLALPLLEETLKLRKARLGADHPHTLYSMSNLAVGYQAAAKLNLALPLHEETLKLTKAKLGPDHPDTLRSMNILAVCYRDAGKLSLALPLLEDTVKLRKAKLGPDHPHTLNSMVHLAAGYRAAGKPELAVALLEETVKLQKTKLGPDHPHTLNSMVHLAACYRDAGKLGLALPLLEETVKLRKAEQGPGHPDTLTTMTHLASAYAVAGKSDLALALLEETLKVRKAQLGADHSDTLTNMNNLAAGYRVTGKTDLALPLYQEAAAAVEKGHFQHMYADLIISGLCDCHEGLQQLNQAETWRRKWLAVVKERSGADSVLYATALASLGWNLLGQQKWTDAEAVLRDCLAIRRQKQPDAWQTFHSQSLLGGALLGRKHYAEAEPLLLQGYAGMKERAAQIPATSKIYLTEALERLVQLYDALEKTDEAAQWRKELDTHKKQSGVKKQQSEKKL